MQSHEMCAMACKKTRQLRCVCVRACCAAQHSTQWCSADPCLALLVVPASQTCFCCSSPRSTIPYSLVTAFPKFQEVRLLLFLIGRVPCCVLSVLRDCLPPARRNSSAQHATTVRSVRLGGRCKQPAERRCPCCLAVCRWTT